MDWDDIYRAVGEVAVAATQLEDSMVRLACVVDDDLDPLPLLASSMKARRAAEQAVAGIEGTVPELHAEAVRFVTDAFRLLDERHQAVHSLTVVDTATSPPSFVQWHAKSDTEVTVDLDAMHTLALRIGGCAVRGWEVANQFKAAQSDRNKPG